MSLTEKQLILLDTIAYYSAFSDINNVLSTNGQKVENTVANVISYIESNSNTTCLI